MVSTSFLFYGRYLHSCGADGSRRSCLSNRSDTLGVSVIRAIHPTFLNDLIRYKRRTNNTLAVELELDCRVATCKLESTKDVVVLADLCDTALLVAGSGRAWDIRDINTSTGVVAICDALVECIGIRCTSRNCGCISKHSSVFSKVNTYCRRHSDQRSTQCGIQHHSCW